MPLSEKEVKKQSDAAFNQWGPTWDSNAKRNGDIFRARGQSNLELLFCGAGKTLVCCAYAPGLEKHMETIKKHRDNDGFDIACVDKCFGIFIENGIIPEYVFLSDAGIDYDKWLAPWVDKTDGSVLISCVTANPVFAENWKGPVFFYVNKDNIQTEKRYMEISGVKEVIPASSNVGNSLVVYAVQTMGYDKYLLVGYDFCWGGDEKYYAYTESDKRYWMAHAYSIDACGRLVRTSQNLIFSCKWLSDFNMAVSRTGVKLFNCSGQGLSDIPHTNLDRELQLAKKRKLTQEEKDNIINRRTLSVVVNENNGPMLGEYLNKLKVRNVVINHVPEGVLQWMQAS